MKSTIVIILVILVIVGGVLWMNVGISKRMGEVHLGMCFEYEANKSIPKGSCECAQRLYPEFDKSYDWMDACAIEEGKNKPLVEASP